LTFLCFLLWSSGAAAAGPAGGGHVTSVREYVDQARLHGAWAAWELAVGDGLPAMRLFDLQARLRTLDPPARRDSRGYMVETEPRFALRPKERRALARRLLEEGGKLDRRTVARLGLSKATAWRVRQEFEGQTPATEPSPDAASLVSERPNPCPRPDPPISNSEGLLVPPPRVARPDGMPAQLCGLCPGSTSSTRPRAAEINGGPR
jgi:hypothetical protein